MKDLRDLIDMTSGSTAAQVRDPLAPWKPTNSARRRLPRRGRLHSRRKPTAAQRHRQYAVTQLADTDRRQLFKRINQACRGVVGRCWRGNSITPAQREQIYHRAAEAIREDGIRVSAEQLAARIDFWLTIYDPAKALWFTIYDVAELAQIIASRLPVAELRRINEGHRDQLDGRVIDYTTLAGVGVAVAKNSLTHNHKTRAEECGTASLIGMLKAMGISANGGLIRVSREILVRLNLMRCTDPRYFTRGMYGPGRCQHWVPCGATWGLPFLSEIRPDELTDAQREEYERYHNPPQAEQPQRGDYNRIVSLISSPITFPSPFTYSPAHSNPEHAPVQVSNHLNHGHYGPCPPISHGSTAQLPDYDHAEQWHDEVWIEAQELTTAWAPAPAEPTFDDDTCHGGEAPANDWDGTFHVDECDRLECSGYWACRAG